MCGCSRVDGPAFLRSTYISVSVYRLFAATTSHEPDVWQGLVRSKTTQLLALLCCVAGPGVTTQPTSLQHPNPQNSTTTQPATPHITNTLLLSPCPSPPALPPAPRLLPVLPHKPAGHPCVARWARSGPLCKEGRPARHTPPLKTCSKGVGPTTHKGMVDNMDNTIYMDR